MEHLQAFASQALGHQIAHHAHHQTQTKTRHQVLPEPEEFISTSSTDRQAVEYLNELFRYAARERISDIHFEDHDGQSCLIRLRRNGELEDFARVDQSFSRDFDAKIRMKCKLSLAERMLPLDGKFSFAVDGRRVDVRVSILPLARGQSIVCRLLDQKNNLMHLSDLNMPPDIRAAIERIIEQPQGLFLVTGPTGSGKTTTLYSLLQRVNQPNVKIITVEDPVEYWVAGIAQSQINAKMGFAQALRAILRQDPDVVLVGEIRDAETARIAVQAALTGHIVLSTLHTNSALITLNRLLDLEVDPHALAAAMAGFMAQRLVRQLCPRCREPVPMTPDLVSHFTRVGFTEGELPDRIFEARGCEHCQGGFRGRLPIFELVVSSPAVRLAIEEGSLKSLEHAAQAQPQYRTLARHALELVLVGETSLSEALAVTGSEVVRL